MNNVIDMQSFKNTQIKNQEESSLSSYYKLLGFNELMNEAHTLILELDNKELSSQIAMKCKMILAEFSKRTRNSGPLVAKAITDLSKNIQQSFSLLSL